MTEESEAGGGAPDSDGGWVSPDRMMTEVFSLMWTVLSCNHPLIDLSGALFATGTFTSVLYCPFNEIWELFAGRGIHLALYLTAKGAT